MLKLQDYAALGGNVRADNIFVLRRKSSWANIGTLLEFVRSLSKILEPVAQTRHIILTLDACPVHLADRVAISCARHNIFMHFVPALMTAWLQPLDAYVFLPLKRFLRNGHHKIQLSQATGQVSTSQLVQLVCDGVLHIISAKPWSDAFAKCGLSHRQAHVGSLVREKLQWDAGVPVMSSDAPSLAQLQAVWITGRIIPIGWLFSLCREEEPVALPGGVRRSLSPAADVHEHRDDSAARPPHVYSGRLRSSSRLDLDCSQPVAQSAAPGSSGDHLPRSAAPWRLPQALPAGPPVLVRVQRLPSRQPLPPLPPPPEPEPMQPQSFPL